MPCYHPHHAWRTPKGEVVLGKKDARITTWKPLQLPCGTCLGCRTAYAKAWAYRCHLERRIHFAATFTTLTYDRENVPLTLSKEHLQLYLKRLRKKMGPTRPIRFLACGEYGEKNGRPHYHLIQFGTAETDRQTIEKAWGLGRTHTVSANLATMSYVAGYTTKKLNDPLYTNHERVDLQTGEVYQHQKPFLTMSKNPGLAAHVRKWKESWRSYAVLDGHKLPVPRYLHKAWRDHATHDEIERLMEEKSQLNRHATLESNRAAENDAITKQEHKQSKRKI